MNIKQSRISTMYHLQCPGVNEDVQKSRQMRKIVRKKGTGNRNWSQGDQDVREKKRTQIYHKYVQEIKRNTLTGMKEWWIFIQKWKIYKRQNGKYITENYST